MACPEASIYQSIMNQAMVRHGLSAEKWYREERSSRGRAAPQSGQRRSLSLDADRSAKLSPDVDRVGGARAGGMRRLLGPKLMGTLAQARGLLDAA